MSEVVWDVIGKVMMVVSWVFGIVMMAQAMRWQRLAKKYEPMAKQLATMLGMKSGEVRKDIVVQRNQTEAKKVLVKNIRGRSFGMLKGMNDDQVISLIFDPYFIKGLSTIVGGAKGLLETFGGVKLELPKIGRKKDGVPTM